MIMAKKADKTLMVVRFTAGGSIETYQNPAIQVPGAKQKGLVLYGGNIAKLEIKDADYLIKTFPINFAEVDDDGVFVPVKPRPTEPNLSDVFKQLSLTQAERNGYTRAVNKINGNAAMSDFEKEIHARVSKQIKIIKDADDDGSTSDDNEGDQSAKTDGDQSAKTDGSTSADNEGTG